MTKANRIPLTAERKLFYRNAATYSAGGIGRDMAYALWNNFILACILLTKNLNTEQFAVVSVIIIVCRIFDAINDPIMGGIVEATATKWGKFKPWIMIGVITNSVILYLTFALPLHGNAFLIFFPFAYILWDITYTMNDIGYWSMLPSLTSNEKDRNLLSTLANLGSGIGLAIVTLAVPVLTTGDFAIGGSAVTAYKIIPIIIVAVFILCQILVCVRVKEKPEALRIVPKEERSGFKQMLKVIKKNDQVRWMSVIMMLFNLGSNITAGMMTYYLYFNYGYQGTLVLVFSIISGAAAAATVLYPLLAKKMTRKKLSAVCLFSIILGYTGMLLTGLLWKNKASFFLLALFQTFTSLGQSIFYMVQTISVANSVEYNQKIIGKRDDGIIFSTRPFMAKMGSALQMAVVAVVFSVLKVADITNGISEIENQAALGTITAAQKEAQIADIISQVSTSTNNWLIVCMTVLPVIILGASILLYLKKYKIDEKTYQQIVDELEKDNADGVLISDVAEEVLSTLPTGGNPSYPGREPLPDLSAESVQTAENDTDACEEDNT